VLDTGTSIELAAILPASVINSASNSSASVVMVSPPTMPANCSARIRDVGTPGAAMNFSSGKVLLVLSLIEEMSNDDNSEDVILKTGNHTAQEINRPLYG
jgi:hypothetical protein